MTFEEAVISELPSLTVHAASRFKCEWCEPEDLAMDTVLHALEKRGLFRPGSSMTAWLRTMMHNLFVNQYRHWRITRQKEYGLPEDSSVIVDEKLARDTLEELVGRERKNDVLDSVDLEVLEMSALGYRYREMAEKLKVPIGTIMSRLHRAREAAKRRMA